MEDLVGTPGRAKHVEVDPPTRHRAQDETAERAIGPAEPGDQQASPCGREAPADAGEQLGASLARRKAHGDVVTRCLRLLERRLQLGDRAAPDGVVVAVASAELVEHKRALDRVVVGDHEQRLGGSPPSPP